MKTRNLVRVMISPDIFPSLFETWNSWVIEEGIPEDSKLMRMTYDYGTDLYYLVFEHSSFEGVQEGEIIPIKEIRFKSIK